MTRAHVHVYVTVCTDANQLVTKCACGERSPLSAEIPAPPVVSRRRKARESRVGPVPAEPLVREPLRAGRCNAADPLSSLRCTWAPAHRPGIHSWVTS